jgi:hypothetical protein
LAIQIHGIWSKPNRKMTTLQDSISKIAVLASFMQLPHTDHSPGTVERKQVSNFKVFEILCAEL